MVTTFEDLRRSGRPVRTQKSVHLGWWSFSPTRFTLHRHLSRPGGRHQDRAEGWVVFVSTTTLPGPPGSVCRGLYVVVAARDL